MPFLVSAKMGGDSVQFLVPADEPKEALAQARAEAMNIFGVGANEKFKPSVAIKPIVDKDE